MVRRSSAFPAFGAPLLAVADGTVVHAEDRQRDHLSCNSLFGVGVPANGETFAVPRAAGHPV